MVCEKISRGGPLVKHLPMTSQHMHHYQTGGANKYIPLPKCRTERLRRSFLSYFFVKKYLLVGASGMLWAGRSVDQRYMYVTPIRLGCTINTNQISCCKGKWYVRRFDPDTVENGHIYSSVKKKFSYLGLPRRFRWIRLRILWASVIQSKKHSVWDITVSMQ